MTDALHQPAGRSATVAASCGAIAAVAAQLNWFASYQPAYAEEPVARLLYVRLAAAALFGPMLALIAQRGLRRLAVESGASKAAKARYLATEHWTWTVLLATCLGAIGVRMDGSAALAIVATFCAAQLALLLAPVREASAREGSSLFVLSVLFMVSGFAALIYQVSWQRALFTAFGVNIESITVVVSLFMFGLGVGAMVGGHLSARYPGRLATLFLAAEMGIAAFGFASLALIGVVSSVAVHASLPVITLCIYALLALPTLCMGATLPILVAHVHAFYGHIGKSVGLLYFVNTVGSALACWMTTDVLFVVGGLQSAVTFAALCNVVVGVSVYLFMVRRADGGVSA